MELAIAVDASEKGLVSVISDCPPTVGVDGDELMDVVRGVERR